MSDLSKKQQKNLELLTQARDCLDRFIIDYSIGEIQTISGSVDIEENKFDIKFTYTKEKTNETTK